MPSYGAQTPFTARECKPVTGEVRVEVVFACPDRQRVLVVTLAKGSTAADAIRQSGIEEAFAGRMPRTATIGVWGRPVAPDHVVQDGDRVEIYRPLQADPREARRQLAAEGKTMGNAGARRDAAVRGRRSGPGSGESR